MDVQLNQSMNSQQTSFLNAIRSRKGCKYAKIPLLNKIRLFKSVLEEGYSIKTISEKLQIKYSTAKTLVRQYKDQQIKIDLGVLQNETTLAQVKNCEIPRSGYRQIRTISHENDQKEDQPYETNISTILSPLQAPKSNAINLLLNHKRVQLVSKTISQQ